jgi:hypothetical protein
MYCRVVKWMLTDVSEVRTASIIRAMSDTSAKGQLVIQGSKWTGLTNGEWVTIGEEMGLSYLTLTLFLSLFYYGPPTHLPLAHLLTYHHPFPIGQPSQLGLI